MQITSLLAYNSIKDTLGEKQKRVLIAIAQLGEATNLDLSNHLKLPINSITPRVNELRKMNLVAESKKDKDKTTGRLSIYWRLKEIKTLKI